MKRQAMVVGCCFLFNMASLALQVINQGILFPYDLVACWCHHSVLWILYLLSVPRDALVVGIRVRAR